MTEETPRHPSWFAGVGWRSVAIAAGAATIGVGALVALNDPAPPAAHYAVSDAPADATTANDVDPLLSELARCRALPANTTDARCQAAWEVNRRRFMGESRSYVPPVDPAALEPTPAIDAAARTEKQER